MAATVVILPRAKNRTAKCVDGGSLVPDGEVRFALNHIIAPGLHPAGFFALAGEVGIGAVEIRNDLAGNAIADGTPAAAIRALAEAAALRILAINALQRFNAWSRVRAAEAEALADYAAACGAEALVLVPTNDGTPGDRLGEALAGLAPILAARGIIGLVEPLGFEGSAVRRKSEAAAAIVEAGEGAPFRLVHDTFHHHLAGEPLLFPELTGLVHISGVEAPGLAAEEMRDTDRGLVTPADRLGNIVQIRALTAAGYDGFLSFEPFASDVQGPPAPAIRRSIAVVRQAVSATGSC